MQLKQDIWEQKSYHVVYILNFTAHPKVLKELTHHMNSDPQIALVHQVHNK